MTNEPKLVNKMTYEQKYHLLSEKVKRLQIWYYELEVTAIKAQKDIIKQTIKVVWKEIDAIIS